MRRVQVSLPSHRHGHVGTQGVHLARFLAKGAEETAPNRQTVLAKGSVDSFVLTDLLSDHGGADEVSDWNADEQPVQDTGLSNLLGNLAFRVAGHEVRDDANRAVAEASEQTRLEFGHDEYYLHNKNTAISNTSLLKSTSYI